MRTASQLERCGWSLLVTADVLLDCGHPDGELLVFFRGARVDVITDEEAEFERVRAATGEMQFFPTMPGPIGGHGEDIRCGGLTCTEGIEGSRRRKQNKGSRRRKQNKAWLPNWAAKNVRRIWRWRAGGTGMRTSTWETNGVRDLKVKLPKMPGAMQRDQLVLVS